MIFFFGAPANPANMLAPLRYLSRISDSVLSNLLFSVCFLVIIFLRLLFLPDSHGSILRLFNQFDLVNINHGVACLLFARGQECILYLLLLLVKWLLILTVDLSDS
jgi:hypothetical protein